MVRAKPVAGGAGPPPAIWSCRVRVPVLITTLRPERIAGTRYAMVLPVQCRPRPTSARPCRSPGLRAWPWRAGPGAAQSPAVARPVGRRVAGSGRQPSPASRLSCRYLAASEAGPSSATSPPAVMLRKKQEVALVWHEGPLASTDVEDGVAVAIQAQVVHRAWNGRRSCPFPKARCASGSKKSRGRFAPWPVARRRWPRPACAPRRWRDPGRSQAPGLARSNFYGRQQRVGISNHDAHV